MDFAFWNNISGTGAEVETRAAAPGRGQFRVDHQMVELFVIGVPEGTTQIKILEKLRANGLSTGNPDGMGFEDEWPDDIRQQGASSLRLVAWSSLQ